MDFRGVTVIESERGQIPCRALNLSRSGMLICPPSWLDGKGDLNLRFALPATGRWLDIDARLVRQSRNGMVEAWGVQFQRVSDEDQNEIDEFIFAELGADVSSTSPTLVAQRPSYPLVPEPALVGEDTVDDEVGAGGTFRGAYGSLDALALAAENLPKRWDGGKSDNN